MISNKRINQFRLLLRLRVTFLACKSTMFRIHFLQQNCFFFFLHFKNNYIHTNNKFCESTDVKCIESVLIREKTAKIEQSLTPLSLSPLTSILFASDRKRTGKAENAVLWAVNALACSRVLPSPGFAQPGHLDVILHSVRCATSN